MKLVISRGDGKGKIFELEEGSNLLGRWDPDSGAFPEVDLEEHDVDAKVSRKHAVIIRVGEKLTLKDLESRNGTFVNRGERLKPEAEVELKVGDEIVVGKVFLTVAI